MVMPFDAYEQEIADIQKALERGVRFGKSRLAANNRVMVGLHGVPKDKAAYRERRSHKRWMKERARIMRKHEASQ